MVTLVAKPCGYDPGPRLGKSVVTERNGFGSREGAAVRMAEPPQGWVPMATLVRGANDRGR